MRRVDVVGGRQIWPFPGTGQARSAYHVLEID
jgi:hypothetical protein